MHDLRRGHGAECREHRVCCVLGRLFLDHWGDAVHAVRARHRHRRDGLVIVQRVRGGLLPEQERLDSVRQGAERHLHGGHGDDQALDLPSRHLQRARQRIMLGLPGRHVERRRICHVH